MGCCTFFLLSHLSSFSRSGRPVVVERQQEGRLEFTPSQGLAGAFVERHAYCVKGKRNKNNSTRSTRQWEQWELRNHKLITDERTCIRTKQAPIFSILGLGCRRKQKYIFHCSSLARFLFNHRETHPISFIHGNS